MKRFLVVALALTIYTIVGAAQQVDDAAVEMAIKAGLAKKFDRLVSSCIATAGFGENMGANMAGGLHSNGAFKVVVC